MKITKFINVGLLLAVLPTVNSALAAEFFSFGVVGPTLQTTDVSDSVEGIRVDFVYGHNQNLTGLDWGLVGLLDGDLTGIQFAAWGHTKGNVVGVQSNFLLAETGGQMTGLQTALINKSGSTKGIQFGFVNFGGNVSGLQIGMLNFAETMNGLQIGLLNSIKSGGTFPIFPIVNWSF
jgi:hypothetical protein